MTQFNPSEIYVRDDAVTVGEIDTKQRLIDLIAVPWDQEAEVPWRGEIWREVFRRGSFDGLSGHAGRVLVTREHKEGGLRGDVVGKLVSVDPGHQDGLFARAKIAQTDLGEETLALAEEDMLSPSVGFRVKDRADIVLHHRTRLREVMRAFLDHISLVGFPAFAGAQVLAVREEQSGPVDPPPGRRALDEAWNHPAYQRALERLTQD